MKENKQEKEIREIYEHLKGIAEWGSHKFKQLENFLKAFEGPERFGDKGIESALYHIDSTQSDSIKSITSFLEKRIKEYQVQRRAYLQENSSDKWESHGDYYPMNLEFVKEVKNENEINQNNSNI